MRNANKLLTKIIVVLISEDVVIKSQRFECLLLEPRMMS
jgi:hypothetical protein